MNQRTLRNMVVIGALVGLLAMFTSPVNAGWGHWRGYYGACGGWGVGSCCDPCFTAYRPCYVPCYTPCTTCYDPCYTSCDPCCDPCATPYVGPLRRLWNRIASHHYGYYGCGWNVCDPCTSCTVCCPVCSCDPCCCGSAWESAGTVIEGPTTSPSGPVQSPTPATVVPSTPNNPTPPPAIKKPADVPPALPKPLTPAKKPTVAPPATGRQTSLGPKDALLTVQVPADAQVYVNDARTRSTGTIRRYVSRNLTPGYQYTYELRVISQQNGRPVVESRTVRLHAGQTTQLAFADIVNPTETMLTLHVPSHAKVFLAGKEMAGQGTVRTFRTLRLAAGQRWQNYAIQVTVQENGRTLAKKKTITLGAGQQRELTFDFGVDQLASAK